MKMCEGRVVQGGLFHVRKVKYNPETHALLKDLIRESKLSIQQRRNLEQCLNNGEPLPLPGQKTQMKKDRSVEREIVLKPNAKRRSLSAIVKSGVYDRDDFAPFFKPINYEKEKEKLQSKMAYGKDIPAEPLSAKRSRFSAKRRSKYSEKTEKEIKDEIITNLIEEINERLVFLEKMENLGIRKKYDTLMKLEINEKLRVMKDIDPNKYHKVRDNLKSFLPAKNVKINTLVNTSLN